MAHRRAREYDIDKCRRILKYLASDLVLFEQSEVDEIWERELELLAKRIVELKPHVERVAQEESKAAGLALRESFFDRECRLKALEDRFLAAAPSRRAHTTS